MAYQYQKAKTGLANLKSLWQASTGLTETPTSFEIEASEESAELVVTLPKVEGALHYTLSRVPLDGIIKEDIVLRSVDVRLDDGVLNQEDVFRAIEERTGVCIGEDDDVRVLDTEDGYKLVACDHSPFFKGEVPLGYVPAMKDRLSTTEMLDWRMGEVNVIEPETILLNTRKTLDASLCDSPEEAGWTVGGSVLRVTRGKRPNRETYFNTPKGTIQARTRLSNDGYVEFDIRVPASAKPATELTRGVYVKLDEQVAAMFQVQGDGLSLQGSEDLVYEHDFTKRTLLGFGYDRTLKQLLLYIDGLCVSSLPVTVDNLPVGTTIVGSFTEREQHFYVYGIGTGSKLPTGFPLVTESVKYSMLTQMGYSDAQGWSARLEERDDYFLVNDTVTKEVVDGLTYGDYWFAVDCEVVSGGFGFSIGDALLKQFNIFVTDCDGLLLECNGRTFELPEGRKVIKGRFLNHLNVLELTVDGQLLSNGIAPVVGELRNKMSINKIDGEQHIHTVFVGSLSKGQ